MLSFFKIFYILDETNMHRMKLFTTTKHGSLVLPKKHSHSVILIILTFYCFFLRSSIAYSQGSTIDEEAIFMELKKEIKKNKTDIDQTIVIDRLNFFRKKFNRLKNQNDNQAAFDLGFQLAEIHQMNYLDSSLVWMNQCYDLAKKIENPSMLTKALIKISGYHFKFQNYKIAEKKSEQADSILRIHPNDDLMIKNLYRLAESYEYNANPEGAMQKYSECYDLAEANNSLVMLTRLDVKMGNIYKVNEDYRKSYETYTKAFNRLDKTKKPLWYWYVVGSMSELVISHPHIFSEEETIETCNRISAFFEDKQNEVDYFFEHLSVLCILRFGTPSEVNSLKLLSIQQIEEQSGTKEIFMTNISSYFEIAMKQKNYRVAKKYINKIKAITNKEVQHLGFRKNALLMEKEFLLAKQDFKNIIPLMEELSEIQGKLESENRMESISNLEGVLKAKEAEYQITLLNKEKEILVIESRNNKIFAFGIGALALLGFISYANAQRKNRIISEQNQKLETLNQTKDRIFAIIGHDLKKPALAFRGITKKINFLLKKQDFKTLNLLGEGIEKDANALHQLTDNLLNWALTQKNVMPNHPQKLLLTNLVRETISLFDNIAREKNITITTSIPDEFQIIADQNSLQIIIRNLVDNALKYTPNGGKILIKAFEASQGVKLKIEDTGVGMSETQLENIFILQKGKSRKGIDGEEGTGLGMHLVQELVKLNQGTINAISQLGKGTSFEISLPVIR